MFLFSIAGTLLLLLLLIIIATTVNVEALLPNAVLPGIFMCSNELCRVVATPCASFQVPIWIRAETRTGGEAQHADK